MVFPSWTVSFEMAWAQAMTTSAFDLTKVHPEYQLNSCLMGRVTVMFPVRVLLHSTWADSQFLVFRS